MAHEVHAARGPGPGLGDGDEVIDKVAHPVRAQASGCGGPALASLRVGEDIPARVAQEGQDGRVVLLGSRVAGDEEGAVLPRRVRGRRR